MSLMSNIYLHSIAIPKGMPSEIPKRAPGVIIKYLMQFFLQNSRNFWRISKKKQCVSKNVKI